MKHILTFLLMFSYLNGFSQTQVEMNENAYQAYNKADKELNSVYQKILTKNNSDTVFIKNLKVSQRIWITFRDSELKVKYPDREPGYYGSVHPMCTSIYLEQLTKERIKTLKNLLEENTEGDVCN